MTGSETLPSPGALEEVRRLAGPSATVLGTARLDGGQHADTWRVDTENPTTSVVVRQFPVGDPAALHEQRVLQALDGCRRSTGSAAWLRCYSVATWRGDGRSARAP